MFHGDKMTPEERTEMEAMAMEEVEREQSMESHMNSCPGCYICEHMIARLEYEKAEELEFLF